jgi:CubicO group peptidase (beta-lactamase class C family)
MKKIFFLFVIIIVCSLTSFSQEKEAESAINNIFQDSKVVGISVAVVKKNKIIYTRSFGLKNVETKTPLADDCIFRIASISKSFSATSIMQLAEANKISLDDDMSKLMGFTVRNPKFPDRVITLRMVMSHRSSINDSQGYFSLDGINPLKNASYAKCYNDYEPGTNFQYCNLNYNMVGTIIERVSGERFDQYVKHHVLDPLNLYGGYCVDSLDHTRFATIYEYNIDSAKFFASPGAYNPRREELSKYVMGYSTPVFSPTGGMKISAHDLADYMIMHMKKGKHKGKRIMTETRALEMQQVISEKDGYGLAITTTEKLIPGEIMKGHTGVAYGLYSAMFFHPKKKFGFVVISNGCHPAYTNGYNTVIRRVIDSLYTAFIK